MDQTARTRLPNDIETRWTAATGQDLDSLEATVSIGRSPTLARSSTWTNTALPTAAVHGLDQDSQTESDQTGLARFDIGPMLGEGGMGSVFRARQASLDRDVALKLIRSDIETNDQRELSFLREAVITGELDHPNIVPIHDLGRTHEGQLFYSMKQIKGQPWSDSIRSQSLSERLQIWHAVADAIAYAHERRVIHRDLKPSNVMIGGFGEVYVVDWGLALRLGADGLVDTELLPDANVGGTPAYMAPEMATNDLHVLGRSADIYLLAAVLYEVVTGMPPHRGPSALQVLRKAALNEIDPVDSAGPTDLIELAQQGMASEPANRPASIQDLQKLVRNWQHHTESRVLADEGRQLWQQAREQDSLRAYERARIALQEAARLWPDNATYNSDVQRCADDHIRCAVKRGDLALAEGLLQEIEGTDKQLRHLVRVALDRQRRRRTWLTVTTVSALTLVVATAIISLSSWIMVDRANRATQSAYGELQDQQRQTQANFERAQSERDRANKAESEATKAWRQVRQDRDRLIIDQIRRLQDEGTADHAAERLAAISEEDRGWLWLALSRRQQAFGRCLAIDDTITAISSGPGPTAIGTSSGAIVLLDGDAATIQTSWQAHTGPVTALAWSTAGDVLLSGSGHGAARTARDGSVAGWRPSGTLLGRLRADNGDHAIGLLAAPIDQIQTMTADRFLHLADGQVFSWSPGADEPARRVFAAAGRVRALACDTTHQRVWTATGLGTIRANDFNENDLWQHTLDMPIRYLAVDDDGLMLAVAGDDRLQRVHWFVAENGLELGSVATGIAAIRQLAWEADGSLAVVGSDGSRAIINTSTGTLAGAISGQGEPVVGTSSTGHWLFADRGGQLRVLPARSETYPRTIATKPSATIDLAFTADGRLLIADGEQLLMTRPPPPVQPPLKQPADEGSHLTVTTILDLDLSRAVTHAG